MDTTEFFEAIGNGDQDSLIRLIQQQPALIHECAAPPNAGDSGLRLTGLHAAIYAGQDAAFHILANAGADLEAKSTEGRTPLHDSIEFGRAKITEFLLDKGVEVDICSAAILGQIDRLVALLDADEGAANDRSTGLSPLGWAAYGNRPDSAAILLERGARMDDGELLCAASVGHVEVGRFLIESGYDPDRIDEGSGGAAVHAAATMRFTRNAVPFLTLLVEKGADLNQLTPAGKTALDLAEACARRQGDDDLEGDEGPRRYDLVIEFLRSRGGRNSS